MINPDDLYIAICDKGATSSDVKIIKVIPMSDPSGNKYAITGVWNNAKDNIAKAKKIMIVANCNASKLSTISLPDLTYNLDTGIRKYIPMWGVASLPELSLGTQTDMTEPIYLLRAMAKVRVGMRSDMPSYGYSIGSMHINNYNTKGYRLPNNYKSLTGHRIYASTIRCMCLTAGRQVLTWWRREQHTYQNTTIPVVVLHLLL